MFLVSLKNSITTSLYCVLLYTLFIVLVWALAVFDPETFSDSFAHAGVGLVMGFPIIFIYGLIVFLVYFYGFYKIHKHSFMINIFAVLLISYCVFFLANIRLIKNVGLLNLDIFLFGFVCSLPIVGGFLLRHFIRGYFLKS